MERVPEVVKLDIPELGLKIAAQNAFGDNPPATGSAAFKPHDESGSTTPDKKKKSGCGCESADASGGLVFLGLLGLVRRRRRR